MFDRFTDRARKALDYAMQEARGMGHKYVGTEHLLLGVFKHWRAEGYEPREAKDLVKRLKAFIKQCRSGK